MMFVMMEVEMILDTEKMITGNIFLGENPCSAMRFTYYAQVEVRMEISQRLYEAITVLIVLLGMNTV